MSVSPFLSHPLITTVTRRYNNTQSTLCNNKNTRMRLLQLRDYNVNLVTLHKFAEMIISSILQLNSAHNNYCTLLGHNGQPM